MQTTDLPSQFSQHKIVRLTAPVFSPSEAELSAFATEGLSVIVVDGEDPDELIPLVADADIVVVRFGEKYKQWNAAFDAGCAVTLGKPIITLHPSGLDHAMKEIDAAANAVAREPAQVIQALAYVILGDMPASTKEAYAAE